MQDVKKRTGFSAYFEAILEPRRQELATYMGNVKRIPVIDANEVSISQKMEWLVEWRETGNLEALANLYEANGNLKAGNYVRTHLMEVA